MMKNDHVLQASNLVHLNNDSHINHYFFNLLILDFSDTTTNNKTLHFKQKLG